MNARYAWLAAACAALIAYGSLFPFTGWQDSATPALAYLSDWSESYSRADVFSNVVAYMPLGFLVASAIASTALVNRVVFALAVGTLLSLSMETLQQFMASRVSSLLDVIMNVCGAAAGAVASGAVQAPAAFRWRATWIKPGRPFDLGLVALAAWALSQWSPFVPSLELSNLRAGVAPLFRTMQQPDSFSFMQFAAYGFSIAGLALVARTLAMPGKASLRLFFAFVAGVLAYKVLVVGRQLSLEAIFGAAAAAGIMPLFLGQRARVVATAAFALILAGFACTELAPGPTGERHSFDWIPFNGHLANPLGGISAVLAALWPACALAYLARIAIAGSQAGALSWKGAIGLACLVFALEWYQQFIPGRHADLTTVLVMVAAWVTCYRVTENKETASTVPVRSSQESIV